MPKKKEFLFICNYSDIKRNYTVNGLIIDELSKKLERINILIVDNLLFFKKKKNIKINYKKYSYYPTNTHFIVPKNTKDFMSKIKKDYYVSFANLGKYLRYFKIHYLIKKKNIRLVNFSNIGFLPENENFINYKIWNYFFDLFNRKIIFGIFKILFMINIFQRVDVRFISNLSYQKYSLNSLSGKLNKFFKTRIFDYYDKYIKVNARIFDKSRIEKNTAISEKYITFVDTNLEHETKVEYEGRHDEKTKKEFYLRLNTFLKKIEIAFNKKVIVCVHPNYSINYSRNMYKNFKSVKWKTDYFIRKAFIYVGFSSSAIVDAIFLKKKIMCLDSVLMGKHHQFTNNSYPSAVGILKYSLDRNTPIDKKKLLKDLNNRIKYYDRYIKNKLVVDKSNIGVEKISKYLKKNYNLI